MKRRSGLMRYRLWPCQTCARKEGGGGGGGGALLSATHMPGGCYQPHLRHELKSQAAAAAAATVEAGLQPSGRRRCSFEDHSKAQLGSCKPRTPRMTLVAAESFFAVNELFYSALPDFGSALSVDTGLSWSWVGLGHRWRLLLRVSSAPSRTAANPLCNTMSTPHPPPPSPPPLAPQIQVSYGAIPQSDAISMSFPEQCVYS